MCQVIDTHRLFTGAEGSEHAGKNILLNYPSDLSVDFSVRKLSVMMT